jgi:Fungal specific transcription factor domain
MWYPNWPVFHKPTFDEIHAPAELLAGMAIIGACMTQNPLDRTSATVWFEAVENWVFEGIDFDEDSISTDPNSIEKRLNTVRAAYCVLLFLTWEGSKQSKLRARQLRFPQVVILARSLLSTCGANQVDLQKYISSGGHPELSWRRFVFCEELIRTLVYVFLLDCAFVIFNNTPPRMVLLQDVRLELPCPEALFQAADAESWLCKIHRVWEQRGWTE